jgi:hypothetical protein
MRSLKIVDGCFECRDKMVIACPMSYNSPYDVPCIANCAWCSIDSEGRAYCQETPIGIVQEKF